MGWGLSFWVFSPPAFKEQGRQVEVLLASGMLHSPLPPPRARSLRWSPSGWSQCQQRRSRVAGCVSCAAESSSGTENGEVRLMGLGEEQGPPFPKTTPPLREWLLQDCLPSACLSRQLLDKPCCKPPFVTGHSLDLPLCWQKAKPIPF